MIELVCARARVCVYQPSAGAFQACTKGKIRPFDDADEEEDIWEDKEINYATQVKSRTRCVSHNFFSCSTK